MECSPAELRSSGASGGCLELKRRYASRDPRPARSREGPTAGPRGGSAPFDPVGHFLAGVAAGFVAGYASHLVLDGMTPAGLPAFA
jgi:hypothetical protein